MAGYPAMHDPMVYYFVWILTPVAPAYAMFKWLPSDASATGPFKGLKWKLGGAFAGYFMIVLISWQFVSKLEDEALAQQKALADAAQAQLGEPWTISGQIRKADGSVPFEAKFLTQPPIGEIRDNGSFSVEVLLPRRKPGDEHPPDLLIKCDGFDTVGISLPWDEESKLNLPPAKYAATRNPEKRTIKVAPAIVMEPLPPGENRP